MTRRHLVIYACLLWIGTAPAIAYAQADFEAWKKKQEAAFESFKSEQDKAFLDFLKRRWEPAEAAKEPGRDEAPKPVQIPPFQADEPTPTNVIIVETPAPPPVTLPPPPVPKAEDDITPAGKLKEILAEPGMAINFFGADIMVPKAETFPKAVPGAMDKQKIADYWQAISNTAYEPTLNALQTQRQRMKLNDWGYARLIYATAKTVYPRSVSTRRLFIWFMLSKSGYLAKVGYDKNEVALLLPAYQTLYGATYYTVAGQVGKFYVARFELSDHTIAESILTYKGNYPGADRRLDMRITQMPEIGKDIQTKTLRFTHRGKEYTTPVATNRTIARFFEHYPQTGYDTYFDAPLSAGARNVLVPALQTLVKDLSEQEAVNLILHFVQTAFLYQTDDEQFRREKPLFPDETLYYPYSDCEDRAILFAYLIRNVLDLEAIGLDYPGHIATAVRFNEEVPGMRVQYDGKTYVICDPTFINADIGRPIPQVQKATPKIIWAMR